MEKRKNTIIWRNLYVVLLIVASIPLSCAYVMEGGEVLEWLTIIENIKDDFSLARSNIWLIFPSILRMIGLNITTTFRLYMLFMNIFTLLFAKKMFEVIFEKEEVIFTGVLLFILSPYRIYILYDKVDLGVVAAWVVIPLFFWGFFKFVKSERSVSVILLTAIAFALIGYADFVLWLMVALVSILATVWYRKFSVLISMFIGCILFLPGLLGKDLILVEPMSSKGYMIGQFFTTWVYRQDYPGFGLGILLSIFILVCLSTTIGNLKVKKKYGFFLVITIIFSFMSMTSFLGNIVQGNVFLGMACFTATVLATYGMKCMFEQERMIIRIGILLFIMIATIAIYVYMCNTLTYYRMPMFLLESL